MKTATFLILSFSIAALFFSCGIKTRTRAMLGQKFNLQIDIAEKANRNNPIALDLLIVYNEKLLTDLLSMSAKQWSENRNQIRRDYIEGTGFDIWSWEWVPGQKVSVQQLPLKAKARGAVVFADYFSPGAHRYRVDPFKSIHIFLLEEDFFIETLGADRK
ncbi:MAG: hypothetical protein PHP23_12735 [Desulfobacterales bacterium]|nr:hypothetical protein [Desulfobacterales bacterium]MDD4073215.1 hypothetical protein [Desulfobacterales bacterium]MDD4393793.1 hypothetical protein [Desulfobacterales bacterium]